MTPKMFRHYEDFVVQSFIQENVDKGRTNPVAGELVRAHVREFTFEKHLSALERWTRMLRRAAESVLGVYSLTEDLDDINVAQFIKSCERALAKDRARLLFLLCPYVREGLIAD